MEFAGVGVVVVVGPSAFAACSRRALLVPVCGGDQFTAVVRLVS